jgi:hypothetical protein
VVAGSIRFYDKNTSRRYFAVGACVIKGICGATRNRRCTHADKFSTILR